MLQGKLTYSGILALAIAYVLKDSVTQDEAKQLANAFLAAAGIISAIYGRYRIARARYE